VGDPDAGCVPSCITISFPGSPPPPSPCGDYSYCEFGTFQCTCYPGYGGDPYDECSRKDSCKTHPINPGVATLIFEGSGWIPAVKNIQATFPNGLPLSQISVKKVGTCNSGKIDIVILPEGYTFSELDEFEDDANLWMGEFLDQEPFKTFHDAFNIWVVPLASDGHISESVNYETYFGLNLNGDTMDRPSEGSAQDIFFEAAVMDAIKHTSHNKTHKYPSDASKLTKLMKQVVPVILVRKAECTSGDDPGTSCSGYSGFARDVTNPSEGKRVRVAISRNHIHEFGHAFGHLRDEYRNDDFKSCTAASKFAGFNKTNWDLKNVNNYSYASAGSELPWRHLLYGAGINPDPQLIGAFEGAYTCWEGGFRPEQECKMNGSHGNPNQCTGLPEQPGVCSNNSSQVCDSNSDCTGSATCEGDINSTNLRQNNYCNWCRELVVMRIHDFIGHLTDEDQLAQWADEYRVPYWDKYPVTLPNDGYPVTKTCDGESKLIWEASPTGTPCFAGVDSGQACPDSAAPVCVNPPADDFSFCTRSCDTSADCDELFTNGCCKAVTGLGSGKYCLPAVSQTCLNECSTSSGATQPDLCDDHVPQADWCGNSTSLGISYCTHECESMFDCPDLFPGGELWGCCAMGGAGVKLCRPAFDPKCD